MKNNNLPLALSFRNCKIEEFKIFKGSYKGAIEIETSDFDPRKLWSDYLRDSYFEDSMLVFINDSMLCIMPDRHTYEYRFEKDVLKVYDLQECEWLTVGYGNKKKLVVVKGLTRVEGLYRSNKLRIKNMNETFTGAFRYAGISSIDEMKDGKAKIYWCNLHYIYQ